MDKSVEVEKVVEDVKPIIPQVTTEVKKIESVENVEEAKYKIIGKAFLDSNKNGQKDKNEKNTAENHDSYPLDAPFLPKRFLKSRPRLIRAFMDDI